MRKKISMVLVILALPASVAIMPAAAQMPGGNGGRPPFNEGGEFSNEQFPEMKARALSMIAERRKRLEEEKSCVEAATTASELRNCRPQPPRNQGRPGGQGGPGMRPQQSWPGEQR